MGRRTRHTRTLLLAVALLVLVPGPALLAQAAAAPGGGGVEPSGVMCDKCPAPRALAVAWVWDDTVFHKYGAQLRLVSRW